MFSWLCVNRLYNRFFALSLMGFFSVLIHVLRFLRYFWFTNRRFGLIVSGGFFWGWRGFQSGIGC